MPDTARPAAKPADAKCPVCGAGFRGADICPRCGTNLETVMRITARAWALRNASRAKLRAGDLAGAIRSSNLAWELQHRGAAAPRLEILLKEKVERSVGIAMLPVAVSPVAVPPVTISDQQNEPRMVSSARIAKTHRAERGSNGAEAPRSPQLPAPGAAARDARVPGYLCLLKTFKMLKKAVFG